MIFSTVLFSATWENNATEIDGQASVGQTIVSTYQGMLLKDLSRSQNGLLFLVHIFRRCPIDKKTGLGFLDTNRGPHRINEVLQSLRFVGMFLGRLFLFSWRILMGWCKLGSLTASFLRSEIAILIYPVCHFFTSRVTFFQQITFWRSHKFEQITTNLQSKKSNS